MMLTTAYDIGMSHRRMGEGVLICVPARVAVRNPENSADRVPRYLMVAVTRPTRRPPNSARLAFFLR
jgi:hypothetical protein